MLYTTVYGFIFSDIHANGNCDGLYALLVIYLSKYSVVKDTNVDQH